VVSVAMIFVSGWERLLGRNCGRFGACEKYHKPPPPASCRRGLRRQFGASLLPPTAAAALGLIFLRKCLAERPPSVDAMTS
jgi:hypothetical protein